jgi:hypothetical protein
MFKAIILILSVTLLSSHSNAAERSFAKYRVGDITHALPVQETTDYIMGIRSVAEALNECQGISLTLENPLIMRTSVFAVTSGRNGCRYTLAREGNWLYKCTLPVREAKMLGVAMESASKKSGMVLGDFTEPEKKVLFDSRFCSEEKMK